MADIKLDASADESVRERRVSRTVDLKGNKSQQSLMIVSSFHLNEKRSALALLSCNRVASRQTNSSVFTDPETGTSVDTLTAALNL